DERRLPDHRPRVAAHHRPARRGAADSHALTGALVRRRPTWLPIAVAAALAAACGGDDPQPTAVVVAEIPRRPYIFVDGFFASVGENSTAIISGSVFDPDTVASVEWSLAPAPPDPSRRRGTIAVPRRDFVLWTA